MPRLMLPSPRGKWRQERLSVAELLCSHQQLFITSLSPSLLYSFSPFNLCVCHSLPPSHSLHVSFCCHLSLSSFHFLPDLFSFLFWVMAHLHVSSFPPSCVVHPLFSFNPFLKIFFAVAPPPPCPLFCVPFLFSSISVFDPSTFSSLLLFLSSFHTPPFHFLLFHLHVPCIFLPISPPFPVPFVSLFSSVLFFHSSHIPFHTQIPRLIFHILPLFVCLSPPFLSPSLLMSVSPPFCCPSFFDSFPS